VRVGELVAAGIRAKRLGIPTHPEPCGAVERRQRRSLRDFGFSSARASG